MNPQNVGAGEDRGDISSDGSDPPRLGQPQVVRLQGLDDVAEKPFAREADEQRPAELAQAAEAGEQGKVFGATLAEAEAGIDDHALGANARGFGLDELLAQAGEDEGNDLDAVEAGQGLPLSGAAARMHEDQAATALRDDAGHGGIPGEAGDIVDDLGAGTGSGTRGAGVVGVDRDDGVGSFAQELFEDGKQPGLLLVGAERGCVGAGGLGAEVHDVGAGVDGLDSGGDGQLGDGGGGAEPHRPGGQQAVSGEAVGGEIDDGHEARALPEGELARAQLPIEVRPVPGFGSWDRLQLR